MEPIRRCEYTHCNKCLEDRRPNVKFCSDNHRKMEGVLKKRELKKKKNLVNLLIQAEKMNISNEELELYKKIFG